MSSLAPLKPVEWPIVWKPGDKFVPVINGSEAKLCCVYVAAPTPECSPTRIAFSNTLTDRLRRIRGEMIPTTDIPGNRVALFWAAWFADEGEARRVEIAAQQYVERRRIITGETSQRTEWFSIRPEWARQAILVAAEKLGLVPLAHESFVKLCQWRNDLPPDRRIPRTKREREAYRRRVLAVAELAIKAGARLETR